MKKISILSIIQASLIQNKLAPISAPDKNKINVKPKAKKIPKGCKIFIIGRHQIVALNEKNAYRKLLNILK
jgi:hypothetical protein